MSKSGYARPVISAQSHSNVIGICHRSCGTKGCWNELMSSGERPSEEIGSCTSLKFWLGSF